eukprot:c11180_g1_i1.p1 GENE.c11180_g1_i1~~c11180_g1_i1.p1  ORF type:complete len:169 (+),score=16.60 c11180_g1_i1:174-680(+)
MCKKKTTNGRQRKERESQTVLEGRFWLCSDGLLQSSWHQSNRDTKGDQKRVPRDGPRVASRQVQGLKSSKIDTYHDVWKRMFDDMQGEDLEMAERKFHEIVVAYETLSDPGSISFSLWREEGTEFFVEKRAKHDRGEDQQRVQFEMNGGSFKVFATGGAAPAFQIPVR